MTVSRKYVDLNTIYKEELVSDTYKINTIRMSHSEVRLENMRNFRNYWLTAGLKAEFDYVRLIKQGGKGFDNGIMMSDTPMERNTNEPFLHNANGDVLIFGLGLGLIVFPLLEDESIRSITVVELYQDLIDIVLPKIKEKDVHGKVKVVKGDCFTYELPKGQKFDTIYFDIWLNICTSDYEEHKKLIRRYSKNLNRGNPNHYMDAWLRWHYKKELRKEKRSGGFYGY